jgi:hypothetical protein
MKFSVWSKIFRLSNSLILLTVSSVSTINPIKFINNISVEAEYLKLLSHYDARS